MLWANDIIRNDTDEPLTLESGELVRTKNISAVEFLAWPPDRLLGGFPVSEVAAGTSMLEGYAEPWRTRQPLDGYVLEPGASIAIGVMFEVADVHRSAAWVMPRVVYSQGVHRYRYDGPAAFLYLTSPGCDSSEDPGAQLERVFED